MELNIEQLKDENEYLRHRLEEADLLFGKLMLAMRAAIIEAEHGEGVTAGMDWIFNTLAGPGEFAPDSETDAQAYFNRECEIIDKRFSELMDYFMARHQRLREKSASQHGYMPRG
ncbi:hypothetical protein [Biostraticola tofi]|uniref:Uncharacterized protein n=1 Tax=Biostraticola tofi TaxID=466109 RepID=A0A4R3Z5A2_9GAMM|nr:hypothetical protein [Biostraticola tofi]TCW00417.1 hypothetical protein EDC52_101767 [Biostraticola tofi]